jgi:hypothetical protein
LPEVPLISLLLQVDHVVDAAVDSLEVGQGPPQPTLVHIPHAAALGFAGNHFLGLSLGADEQHFTASGRHLGHCSIGIVNHTQRLLQVNDVDAIALREDVPLHPRIPAAGLMPKVDPCL